MASADYLSQKVRVGQVCNLSDSEGDTMSAGSLLRRAYHPALALGWLASAFLAIHLLGRTLAVGMPSAAPLSSVVHEVHGEQNYSGDMTEHSEAIVSESPARFYERLDLRVDFCVDQVNSYANVFQTADANAGFRLEASEQRELVLCVGDPEDKSVHRCRFTLLPRLPQGSGWHSLRIRLEDGVARIDYDGVSRHVLGDLHRVAASRVILGNGFNGNRPLIGQARLTHYEAETGLDLPRPRPNKAARVSWFVAAALLHVSFVSLVGWNFHRRSRPALPDMPTEGQGDSKTPTVARGTERDDPLPNLTLRPTLIHALGCADKM
jgi:hypothetical protein